MTSSCPECRLTPAKRILPCSFAMRWASSRSSVSSAAAFLPCRYQMSTWSVPSCRRLSSRWARASAFVAAARLRGDEDLVAPALEGRAHEALVVAALVAAGGVEEVHAEVGRPLDDALVGGDHAAEGDLGHLEAGLAELPLPDDRGAAVEAGAIAGGAGFGVVDRRRGRRRGGRGRRGPRWSGTHGGSGGWTW